MAADETTGTTDYCLFSFELHRGDDSFGVSSLEAGELARVIRIDGSDGILSLQVYLARDSRAPGVYVSCEVPRYGDYKNELILFL
jgi:hypothetical protein